MMLLSSLFLVFLLSVSQGQDPYEQKRFEMVEGQIISRGIQDSVVIKALLAVPRHEFVPENLRNKSYDDGPLPIGNGQTISQPYIVALMTELVAPAPGKKILEIGTGSGYQAAVLAETGCDLYTVEIIEPLAKKSREVLEKLGYSGIKYKIGDGFGGWEQHAPYDGIIVTAAPKEVPEKLMEQLKPGGKMVIPVGSGYQELKLIEKKQNGVDMKNITSVRFVPMTGNSIGE